MVVPLVDRPFLSPSLSDFLSYAVGGSPLSLARQAPTTLLSDRAAFAWRVGTDATAAAAGIIIVRRRATEIGFLHSTVRPSVRPSVRVCRLWVTGTEMPNMQLSGRTDAGVGEHGGLRKREGHVKRKT